MKLSGQTAVVTGGGSGIGAAIARHFAQEGARVVVAEIDGTRAKDIANSINADGGEALDHAVDVGEAAAVAELFQVLDDRDWSVDILVNNAGNTSESDLSPTADVTDERWDAVLRVHLSGTFYCTRQALRRMVPRRRGTIINLGSVAGLHGMPGATAYTAAKGGIIAMTKALSQEVAPRGIRVNCIAPGWIDTPMLPRLRPRMVKRTPMGRVGQPNEVASVAVFLASTESSFVTGQVISPNGGLYS